MNGRWKISILMASELVRPAWADMHSHKTEGLCTGRNFVSDQSLPYRHLEQSARGNNSIREHFHGKVLSDEHFHVMVLTESAQYQMASI